MARRRTKKTGSETEPVTQTDSDTAITTERKTVKMAGLTAEQIATLLGKTRQKGLYVEKLNEFIDSEEAGIDVGEQWVEFRDKKATTLKQGFDNAKDHKDAREDADKTVKVVSNEEHVYLINLAVAGASVEEAA
jgi:hypothetical protein